MRSQDRDVDVIIIGAGGAGLAAAITASELGASVMLIEADSRVGGSTALSGGVYYAAGTRVQVEAGIHGDTTDAMFEYYMTLNQYRVDAALARTLCDGAAEGLHWLMSLGVEFPAQSLYTSGVESVPRGHSARGNGAAIATAMESEVRRQGIEIINRTRVERLLTDADGRVTGVHAAGADVRAGAVVIATGGFGANPHLLHQYYPEATRHGDATWYIGNPNCIGDGLTLAARAGADIVGHNRGLLLTTPNFRKVLEAFVPGWLVYVNREGRRFVRETAEYAVMSGVVAAQTGGTCFALFDDVAKRSAEPAAHYADAFASGALPLNWVADELEAQTRTGKVMSAPTLSALAVRCGIRPGSLESTVARYNADAERGLDSQFFKAGDAMKPIATPPFHAVEIRPAIVCLTSTGVRIDASTRALDTLDRPIPGLYAAGETTGGVLGERYIGGGNSIANAIVFGRIAGREAARAVLNR